MKRRQGSIQNDINNLDLYSTSEAAEYLGCSDSYVRRLCRLGKIAHFAADKAYYIPYRALLFFDLEREDK